MSRPSPPARPNRRICIRNGGSHRPAGYRDANGAMLQIVFRFDPPDERKQFLPCTLWRDAKGLRWHWKGLPAARPLYAVTRQNDEWMDGNAGAENQRKLKNNQRKSNVSGW